MILTPLHIAVAELEFLPGVHRIILDEERRIAHVVCDEPPAGGAPLEAILAPRLQEVSACSDWSIEFSYRAAPEPRRRVRLESAEVVQWRSSIVRATVGLEWLGSTHVASVQAEGGSTAELRAVAGATIQALHSVLDGAITFYLTSAKVARIYDEELILALLHRQHPVRASLVGVARNTETLALSTARAVLNATNRVLGNYLHDDG